MSPLESRRDLLRRVGSKKTDPSHIAVGVIGLGLMGTSIVACLLAAGHPVVAVSRSLAKHRNTKRQVRALLREMKKAGLLKSDPARIIQQLSISENYAMLADREIVVESIIESLETKKEVLRRVEEVVSPQTIIGSNTSAIPVTTLQEGTLHPERIIGIHWAEPAHVTRFMEVICGRHTRHENAERVLTLARGWGKEPSLLRRDIRGFITNRIMYAMLREAFYLVESGYASVADVDRSLRNDLGYWITFAGPFRFMDLTGIPAYEAVMRDLLSELCNDNQVPSLMKTVVASGARGVSNAKGFYSYTPAEAKRWEKRFLKFTYEIRALAQKYPDPG